MGKSVKLSDIAKQLNVSTVTVSKALAGKSGVSLELRDKIKDLANEMGYKRPAVVQTESQTYNIGVLVSEMYLEKNTSFYWELYQNVVTHAAKNDCFTMLEVLSLEDEKNLVISKMVREKKADGIIVIGIINKQYLTLLKENSDVPLVYLDFYYDSSSDDFIISDSFYGTYIMTNYLFEMGHRNIGFVGTVLATSSITDRYFGYTKSLLEHGVKQREDWVINDRDLVSKYLKIDLPDEMPSAFVCNCDRTAYELMRKLVEKGYRIPEDVSVVGFDNYYTPVVTDVDVALTTYEVDMKEMARMSIYIMLKRLHKDHYKSGITMVQGRVVIRDSVKKLNE